MDQTTQQRQRTQLVSWLLVDTALSRIPPRPWAVEAALGRLALCTSPPEAPVVHQWRTPTPLGDRFPGLGSVVRDLAAHGGLEPTEGLPNPGYRVDRWWQERCRDELLASDESVPAILAAASYLASLCAADDTASKMSNTAG